MVMCDLQICSVVAEMPHAYNLRGWSIRNTWLAGEKAGEAETTDWGGQSQRNWRRFIFSWDSWPQNEIHIWPVEPEEIVPSSSCRKLFISLSIPQMINEKRHLCIYDKFFQS